ncbi:MAG: S-methyl-5'-thioadenosine phosphorylase, partial [Thermoproteota archaeon]
MPRIGIIGGSGVYELIEESTTRVITTPFGDVGV